MSTLRPSARRCWLLPLVLVACGEQSAILGALPTEPESDVSDASVDPITADVVDQDIEGGPADQDAEDGDAIACDTIDCHACAAGDVSCLDCCTSEGRCGTTHSPTGPCIAAPQTSCRPGLGDCDGNPANGCETDITADEHNCGKCGTTCKFLDGSGQCTAGACVITSCNQGYDDCDGDPSNGCESPLNTAANCGLCHTNCHNDHGAIACTTGSCVASCAASYFTDCDGTPTDGCETNTNTDVENCGACGKACAFPHAAAICLAGTCTLGPCDSGYADCDGNPENGCEATFNTATHCGACGNACTNDHGTTSCSSSGDCIPSCASGYLDCNGNPADGCETDKNTDKNNCGACGNVCDAPGGGAKCVGGVCKVDVCPAGRLDCNGDVTDGCETDSAGDVNHCGGCAISCVNAHGTTSCVNGQCAPICSLGYGDCDGNKAGGCETKTDSDVSNCGTCGRACPTAGGTPNCVVGQCGLSTCSAGLGDCDGNPGNGCETDLRTSGTNCGACGKTCSNAHGSTGCSDGVCTPICITNFGDCDSNPSNGCEQPTNTATDCGTCGHACSLPNANASCSTGACVIASCNTGFDDCDGITSTGCETALNTVSHCGSCANACSNSNGTTACSGGLCAPSCVSRFASCDGNPSNGCESPLNVLTDCGGCSTACSVPNATASCSTGSCALVSCNVGYGNCDDNAANGCETLLDTTTNCGACGHTCISGQTCSNGTCTCNPSACPSCADSALKCCTSSNTCSCHHVGTPCD